ncbi:MAG: 3-hydroxyacyl-ACP dehydratase FabZ [Verrucomicrobiota bacterium]|nr:3-hydroxyacyl-ACP dehydratase FabZ [Verrucomicrobiota bacterium]
MQVHGLKKIKEILPQRYPFLMIDRFTVSSDKKTIKAIKNVSFNEEFFQGHFPGAPIMPGVLQLEAMTQVASVMIKKILGVRSAIPVLKSAKKIKFRNPVVPGDQLAIEAECISFDEGELIVKAKTLVDNKVTCQGEISVGFVMNTVATGTPEKLSPPLFNNFNTNAQPLNVQDIMKSIPHRYPFMLIDRILFTDEKEKRMVGLKNITANEPCFNGYFPSINILPNCLQMEIAAQLGCAYNLSQPENAGKIAYFMSIDKAKFYAPVLPGDQLVIDINLSGGRGRFGKADAKLYVGNNIVSEGVLKFVLVEKE